MNAEANDQALASSASNEGLFPLIGHAVEIWGEDLTDNRLEFLLDILQYRFGLSREGAEHQIERFMATIRSERIRSERPSEYRSAWGGTLVENGYSS